MAPFPCARNAADTGECRPLASLCGSLVLFNESDFECWNLWWQDKEQPEVDEAENNSATVRSYYHHTEEASAEERGLLP